MKKIYFLLSIGCVMSISCIDRNMPGNYPYTFSILDSSYNNLVGDSVNVNRYDIES